MPFDTLKSTENVDTKKTQEVPKTKENSDTIAIKRKEKLNDIKKSEQADKQKEGNPEDVLKKLDAENKKPEKNYIFSKERIEDLKKTGIKGMKEVVLGLNDQKKQITEIWKLGSDEISKSFENMKNDEMDISKKIEIFNNTLGLVNDLSANINRYSENINLVANQEASLVILKEGLGYFS